MEDTSKTTSKLHATILFLGHLPLLIFSYLAYKFTKLWRHFVEVAAYEPPVLGRWIPIFGKALAFQKDPQALLMQGFNECAKTPSNVFGLKVGSLTSFVISQPVDMDLMIADSPYEAKFSLQGFFSAIDFPIIVHKDNFDSNLHIKLLTGYFANQRTVSALGHTILAASNRFIDRNINQGREAKLVPLLTKYVTQVMAVCLVGEEVERERDLLDIFARFNDHAGTAVGLASLLPSFLHPLAGLSVWWDYRCARTVLIPIIRSRRQRAVARRHQATHETFLDFVIDVLEDDEKVADMILIAVWGRLTNLQTMVSSLIMDIINAPPDEKEVITKNLNLLDLKDLSVYSKTSKPDPQNPWTPLRAAMFESTRLAGAIITPSRRLEEDVILPSSQIPNAKLQVLPKSSVATISAYYTHRSKSAYGNNAKSWDPKRFFETDPDIGTPRYISYGLNTSHLCPGRWFAQEFMLVTTKCLLARYSILPDKRLADEEKYVYSSARVTRQDVSVSITSRL